MRMCLTIFVGLLLAVAAQATEKRWIIVFKSEPALQQAAQTLEQKSQGQIEVEEDLEHLQSLVIRSDDENAVAALRAHPEVALVDEEVFHPAPKISRSLGPILDGGGSKSVEILTNNFQPTQNTPWGILAVKAVESWSSSRSGEGARVLVLDTGIDKDHPSLVSNFERGEDFVGDNQRPYPFADPVGHGTHVAGTIAGAADTTGFTGVAPKAKILAGRVCSNRGCSNISIARGINWGIQQNVDVISMSLGGGMSTPAERDAVRKADAAGITIVAASGNDGSGRVSFPAALPQSIAVGAIDDKLQRATFSQYGPELAVVAPGVSVMSTVPQGSGREADVQIALPGTGFQRVSANALVGGAEILTPVVNDFVYAGLGKPEDFAATNVRGKFALIARGEITFLVKVQNAINAGASGVVIFNNEPGLIQGALTQDGSRLAVPVFMIEKQAGETARSALQAGQNVQSRLLVQATNYSALDGTSMATPHVSGVVALMKAANPALKPTQVKDILKRTATPLSPNSRNEHGAGLINADEAVRAALSAPAMP